MAGWRLWSSSLVLMLHLAFACIPAGLASLGVLPVATGLHLPGIGGFGSMTLAVMMRASLGHTGRDLQVRPGRTLAFACVLAAALVRVLVPAPTGLWCAAVLSTPGFGLFVWRFAPVLTQPNPARRQPNGP